MKNGSIPEQLKMQERQISDETTFDGAKHSQRKNTDMQAGIYADNQDELTENKFVSKQENHISGTSENKQSFNLSEFGVILCVRLVYP
jgi:hypothetical protein